MRIPVTNQEVLNFINENASIQDMSFFKFEKIIRLSINKYPPLESNYNGKKYTQKS